MKKFILEVELTIDDDVYREHDKDERDWFFNDVLLHPSVGSELILHSNEIGDSVGDIRVLSIKELD